jgi:hypothetical protein
MIELERRHRTASTIGNGSSIVELPNPFLPSGQSATIRRRPVAI